MSICPDRLYHYGGVPVDVAVDVQSYDDLSDAISDIGATETTIVISDAQTVSTDETVPATMTMRFLRGGSLSIDTGKTVTINGQIEAGLFQIFSGAGTVAIGNVSVKIIPQWWGASPSATAAVNSTAINASIVALSDYGNWELPGGEYDISTAIAVSTLSGINMSFSGRLLAQSCSGISFTAISDSTITGIHVTLEAGNTWGSAYTGITLEDVNHTEIHITRVYDFGKALHLNGDNTTGIAYNDLHLGYLIDCKYGIYIESTGGGWVNENNFYGGAIRLFNATKAAEAGGWAIHYVSTPAHQYNNHRYYGLGVENHHNGIQFNSCKGITLITPRFEDVDANWVAGGDYLYDLVWTVGVDIFDETMVDFDENCRGVLILGISANDTNYKSMILDSKYGGISFALNRNFADVTAHLSSNAVGAVGLTYEDIFGKSQYLNKSYTGATAPTSGTYAATAIVWNSSPSAGGWTGVVCTASGTADTLAGVTGGITTGTKKLTVNSATDLQAGMFITIAGVTGVKNIEYIDGNDVYIVVAADATVAGAAVAYSAPSWMVMGNFELQGSDTWDPASIGNGAEEAKDVTVAGAALGDFAIASFSLDVTDLVLNAQVTNANVVTCVLSNNTGGAIDLASGTIKAKVFKA